MKRFSPSRKPPGDHASPAPVTSSTSHLTSSSRDHQQPSRPEQGWSATAMVAAVGSARSPLFSHGSTGTSVRSLTTESLAAWISFVIGLVVIVVIVVASKRHRKPLVCFATRSGKKSRSWPSSHLGAAGWSGGATFVAAQSTTVQYLGVAVGLRSRLSLRRMRTHSSLIGLTRPCLACSGDNESAGCRRDHRNRRCRAHGRPNPRQRRRLKVRGVDLRADRGTL